MDEGRSLLPPLLDRPPIYTYYDPKRETEADVRSVEHELLLTWRRAWWAKGFKPIILGPPEAVRNPLHEKVQRLNLDPEMAAEISSWLAWERMGDGILCHYLALPMGGYEDPLLSYLRQGEYQKLTRYDTLSNGLYVGPKSKVTAAITAVLATSEFSKAKYIYDLLPNDTFKIDDAPSSIAYYDMDVVNGRYPKIAEELPISKSKGMKLLNRLINAHLHNTWRSLFSSGISVVKPIRTHMTAIVEPAVQLAEFLAQCPSSPIASSCPPNNRKCNPCVSTTPMRISTPPHFRNISTMYTIGVVPHPWTTTSLDALTTSVDVPFIRRKTERDRWLQLTTQELLGTGVSTSPRLVKFKEAVASPFGTAHSVWFTAEKEFPDDLDWHFGFVVPRSAIDDGKSQTPVPGPERRPGAPARDPIDGPLPDEKTLAKERKLLEFAKMMGGTPEQQRILKAIEAWSLADVEAWRFARAFMARRTEEREKWEEEERRVTGGAGSEKGPRRLFD